MSGIAITRAMLVANANLIAVIPAARIVAGALPLNSALPAISITQISDVEFHDLAMRAPTIIVSERVQVTVLFEMSPDGSDYAGLKAALELVSQAMPNYRGTLGAYSVDSIRPGVTGPEFEDMDFRLLSQSKDFLVQFYAAGA